MSDTATQQGVVDQEIIDANAEPTEQESAQEASGQRQETERERIIREMSERRHAELNGEEAEFTEAAGNQQGIEDRFEPEPDAQRMVTIKVDGEERQVPEADVLEHGKRALQKESAADKRLAEAAQIRQMAEARAAQVEAFARQLQAQQEHNQGKQLSDKDAGELKDVARDVYEKIMSGDEDEAINALANMVGRGNATQDVNAIMQQAKEAARAEVAASENQRKQEEAAVNHKKAKAAFSDAYPEIGKDPMLYRLADQETLQVLSDHPDWDAIRDIDKILMEAGKRVMDWRGKNAPSSKTEMKRGMKPIRQADARMQGVREQKPLTTSEVIAQQRRARGLPVY